MNKTIRNGLYAWGAFLGIILLFSVIAALEYGGQCPWNCHKYGCETSLKGCVLLGLVKSIIPLMPLLAAVEQNTALVLLVIAGWGATLFFIGISLGKYIEHLKNKP